MLFLRAILMTVLVFCGHAVEQAPSDAMSIPIEQRAYHERRRQKRERTPESRTCQWEVFHYLAENPLSG